MNQSTPAEMVSHNHIEESLSLSLESALTPISDSPEAEGWARCVPTFSSSIELEALTHHVPVMTALLSSTLNTTATSEFSPSSWCSRVE